MAYLEIVNLAIATSNLVHILNKLLKLVPRSAMYSSLACFYLPRRWFVDEIEIFLPFDLLSEKNGKMNSADPRLN